MRKPLIPTFKALPGRDRWSPGWMAVPGKHSCFSARFAGRLETPLVQRRRWRLMVPHHTSPYKQGKAYRVEGGSTLDGLDSRHFKTKFKFRVFLGIHIILQDDRFLIFLFPLNLYSLSPAGGRVSQARDVELRHCGGAAKLTIPQIDICAN